MEMNAQSTGTCSGDMSFSGEQDLTGGSAAGAASGSCYSSGSCVYACYTTTECCGMETWTLESYTCTEVCSSACGNGECETGEDTESCPEDCTSTYYCGNGTCDDGESCICQGEEEDCEACLEDCCPVCGDGICEFPEPGGSIPGSNKQIPENATCEKDCMGSCEPSCPDPFFCGDDGCGGDCAFNCAGGSYCDPSTETCQKNERDSACDPECPAGFVCAGGQCEKEPEPPSPQCVHSGECQTEDHCVSGACVACPPACDSAACESEGCGGCGQCPVNMICKDTGKCTPP
jgi:hypothetical protein